MTREIPAVPWRGFDHCDRVRRVTRCPRIRVGVWGIGAHVRRTVIPAIRRSDRVELVGLHTRTDTVLRDVAVSTGATPYADRSEFLGTDDIDVVYLATPTGVHASMALETISAGKHLWCEKPMTTSLEQTESIVAAAQESRLVALESAMFLHHPQFLLLQDIIASDEVGEVATVTARFGFPHRSQADFRYSRELGGGALLDAGFYPAAAVVALLGIEARVAGSVITTSEGVDADTGGSALVVLNQGAGLLDWGFGRSYRNEIEVWCEEGTIAVTRAFSKPAELATQIVIRPQSGDPHTIAVPPADQFSLMLEDFAAITCGERPYDPRPVLARSRLLTEIRDIGESPIG